MPDLSARKGDASGHRPRISSLWSDGSWRTASKRGPGSSRHHLILLLALQLVLWPILASVQAKAADGNPFDIGIVIDNRPLPRSEAASADVDLIVEMLDRQVFIEHIMVFERPSVQVICGLFGCPETVDATKVFPPLIWQITREDEARLFVYYIGDGRAEGLERQLLFKRRDHSAEGDVVGLSVNWLHRQLEAAAPTSVVLMLDSSFAPEGLPCAYDDQAQITDALSRARQNYRHIANTQQIPAGHTELSATTPVHAPHCNTLQRMLGQPERSLFMNHVIGGLVEGAADQEPFGDEDRLIELGELADYLNEHIERSALFQWGYQQNVRAAGSQSRVLAAIDGRKISEETEAILERRRRPPTPIGGEQIIGKGESGEAGEGAASKPAFEDRASRCRADPAARDCHPCVFDPGSRACAERCQQDGSSDLCARHLTSSTDPAAADMSAAVDAGDPDALTAPDALAVPADNRRGQTGGVTVTTLNDGQLPPATTERSTACGWTAERIAPFASALMRGIDGDTMPSCNWAADPAEPERSPLAQVFTPIGWRLGRSTVQDAVMCLLDCNPGTRAVRAQAPIDPRSLSGFNREVCDRLPEPVPSYIGLPRWMPGTLFLSEVLQAGYGCPPPAAEPIMPVPLAVMIEAPPGALDPKEPEEPASPQPSDVIIADDRLEDWPPYAARTDQQPEDKREAGAGGTGETAPTEGTAPSETDDRQDEPAGPVEAPFAETQDKVRWLQRALTVDNRNPGPIDGIMGEKTMAAILSWRQDNDRADQKGPPSETEFQEIIEQFALRFGQLKPAT